MKGISRWNHTPYRPFDRACDAEKPFICRLAPGENGVEVEWFDHGSSGAHELWYRQMKSYDPWIRVCADTSVVRVDGLAPHTDYEMMLVRCEEETVHSAVRYARTGKVPGTVVNYLHPADTLYAFSGRSLCSPSIARLPSGRLLTSMDVFAGTDPQNLTLIFRSDDDGVTWHYVTDLFPCFWGTLFVHENRLYMLGSATEYGDLLISESKDEGQTWCKPAAIFFGSGSYKAAGWQHTPNAFLRHNGRLYTSIDYGAWSQGGHGICLLSVPEDADLLDSENWTVSPPTPYSSQWPGAPVGHCTGLLEGNMVISPDGRLVDILRIQMNDCTPNHGMALALQGDLADPEAPLTFDSFLDLPTGANSKTHILFDAVSGCYVGIGNLCVDERTPSQRNVLALVHSRDLYHWKVSKILLDYRHMPWNEVGFQYIFFLIDGEDILYLSRTSINAARNFHDANYQTFHKIENFRSLLS